MLTHISGEGAARAGLAIAMPQPWSPGALGMGTIDTSTIDRATHETFDQALTGEIIRSEILRLTIVALILGLGLVRWIAGWISLALGREDMPLERSSLPLLAVVGGLAVAYELYAIHVARRAIRGDGLPSGVARYRNALIETSLPTLFLVLSIAANSPPELYIIPVAWLFFVFILLSILHLDFWLCAFTGLVAGVEYAWLSMLYLSVPRVDVLDPGLMSSTWPALRVGLLIGCGLLAGLISLRIRRYFAAAIRSVQERNRVVSTFGQHVSPAVVDQLLSQDVDLESELRDVCVMFVDIQGFTTFSENRRPEEVVAYLNGLFSAMIERVNDHHGIVNKFLGDGFMAIFGAPIPDERAAQHGVDAALAILAEVEAMSASGTIAPTKLRIGLHAGEVVTCTVGSSVRKEYTIIGDVVNIASRLEQMNKELGTRALATKSVVGQLRSGTAQTTPIGSVVVRGREHPIDVFAVA